MIKSWLDNKDRLRIMTFEKRLETHQKAYAMCQQLNGALSRKDKQTIGELAKSFSVWWDENCFYLDENSRMKVGLFIDECYDYDEQIWRYLREACQALSKGIDEKYLDRKKSVKQ